MSASTALEEKREIDLSSEEIRRISSIVGDSDNTNEAGFFVAFQETNYPHRSGFSLLVHTYRGGNYTWSALYAEAMGISEPFQLSGIPELRPKDYVEFITSHLNKTTELIGMSSQDFMSSLCNPTRCFIWRFQGYVDKSNSKSDANKMYWRFLWGRIIELTAPGRLQIEGMGEPDITRITKCLRDHAVDGQIVLER